MPTNIAIDYVLDTNIVIHAIEGVLRQRLARDSKFAVSAVSRLELLGVPNLPWDSEMARKEFLSDLSILPVDDAIIDEAIHLRRHRGLTTPDAIIAATALHYKAILLTNDGELLRALGPMAQPVPLVAAP